MLRPLPRTVQSHPSPERSRDPLHPSSVNGTPSKLNSTGTPPPNRSRTGSWTHPPNGTGTLLPRTALVLLPPNGVGPPASEPCWDPLSRTATGLPPPNGDETNYLERRWASRLQTAQRHPYFERCCPSRLRTMLGPPSPNGAGLLLPRTTLGLPPPNGAGTSYPERRWASRLKTVLGPWLHRTALGFPPPASDQC